MKFSLSLATLVAILEVTLAAPANEPRQICTLECRPVQPACDLGQVSTDSGTPNEPCWSCCRDIVPVPVLKPKQVSSPAICTLECRAEPDACGGGNNFPKLSGECWSCCSGEGQVAATRQCKNNVGTCDKSFACFENGVAPDFGEGRCAVNIKPESETPCWKNCGGERQN